MISEKQLYKEIGRLIREAREKAGLNQTDLAQLIGLQRTSITNIEAGKQKIQIHTLFNIAQALHIAYQNILPSTELPEIDKLDKQLQDENLDSAQRRWVRTLLLSENHEDEN